MAELFGRVKRYEEEARIDNDEVRQALSRTTQALDERLLRDKKDMREMLDHEASDLSRRVDKCNLERLNDSADLQSKLGMLGKSASRHLEHLKHALYRETQNMIELASKTGSVMFSAYRDDGDSSGGESYVTFTGCNVNIGNGFIPKSGVFQCPEPGLYLFTFTVCTFDGKKCLMILKKNEKDVCALIDQDGNENRGKTMISQTCMLELDVSDRVQIYAVTGTGFTDGRSSHYTQFCGVMLRASAETLKAASRGAMEEDDVSVGADFRGLTPVRGFTPGPGGDLSRRNSKKERRFNGSGGGAQEKAMSPRPDKAMSPKPDVAPIPEVAEERLVVKEETKKVEETPKEEDVEEKAPVAQQSYLALTKLGSAEKRVVSPSPGAAAGAAGESKVWRREPGSGLFSVLKGR